MKFKIFFFLIITSLLIASCNKETVLESSDNNSSGDVLLTFNKSSIPSSVVKITASLTREGYSPISRTLEVNSDTTAELTFTEIPIGKWNLKIDAFGENDSLLYTGETDITIVERKIIDVSLTLYEVSKSTGGVHINIKWGNTSYWIFNDCTSNPVFYFADSSINYVGNAQAKIIYDNGKYKMFYNNLYNGHHITIGYAESNDGTNWYFPFKWPILTPGYYGSWEGEAVEVGAILKENGYYKMYYTGSSSSEGNWHIGLAISQDGINWEKQVQPVLYADVNEPQIHVDEVIKVNDLYLMYYTVRKYPNYNIGLATSLDGLHWTKHQNPLLQQDKLWEGSGIYFPSVINENRTLYMVYMNSDNSKFGMAKSYDGISWSKMDESPVFSVEDVFDNWCYKISYPCFRKINNEYRIYYTGTNQSETKKIGYAVIN